MIDKTDTAARYEKRELIGAGGMAAVWRGARILGDGSRQDVAIKEIIRGARRHPDAIERFCREARLCMAVNHENVVRVYDLVRDGEHYQIIMEYVDGVTLQTLVESGLQLPVNVQRFIHGQVVAGLDGLHRERILHRDLSPVNVMVSRDGMVKLIDLGVAKDLAGPATGGGCKGTLPFMSPELLRGESADGIDERSDLYSAIAVLYYCLTGNAPVSGDTPEAILANHKAGDLAPFPALLPPDLRVILDDLRNPPADRTFQQTAQIIRHLFQSASGDSHYLATRDEVAIFVQSVMDDQVRSGKEAVRITEVMSEQARDDIPATEPDGVADDRDDALDSALDRNRRNHQDDEGDEVDTTALLETLAFCFSGQAPPGLRAAALRALLSELAPDGSDNGSADNLDNAEGRATLEGSDEDATPDEPVETAAFRPDDILALLAHLPDEDDDHGMDSTQRGASAVSTEIGGDVATRILLELRARYPVFQDIDRDAWTELLDDVQYWLRDYLVPLPDFDNFEDGILLAVQARYPEFKGVNIDPATWKAMFREVWVDLVQRIASDHEPEIASEIISKAMDELEAGSDGKLIEDPEPEAILEAGAEPAIETIDEPEVEAMEEPEVGGSDEAKPEAELAVEAEAEAESEDTLEAEPSDKLGTSGHTDQAPHRWTRCLAAVAMILVCIALVVFCYPEDRVTTLSSQSNIDDTEQYYQVIKGDRQ